MATLTPQEAADTLGFNLPDEMRGNVTSILLPAIDMFIKDATGRDWSLDENINPTAKMVASVLLVRWNEDPGLIGKAPNDGIVMFISQLHAKALLESDAT